MFITVCIIRDMVIYQGDINTAYLNATLGRNQYLDEIEGYPCEDKGMIYIIDKALMDYASQEESGIRSQ